MRILYLSGCFPLLSETFTIYEIADLIKQGADIRVLSLSRPEVSSYSDLPQKLGFENRIMYRPELAKTPLAKALRILKILASSLGRKDFATRLKLFISAKPAPDLSRYVALETMAAADVGDWVPDLVHCHFGPNGNIGVALKNYGLTNAIVTTIFHGYDISQLPQIRRSGFYEELFKNGDWIFSINKYYLKNLQALNAERKKTSVFHMSVDCNDIAFKPRSIAPSINCITVGRMTEKKGHIYTVKAFAKVVNARPDLDLKLHIVGDGPLFGDIEEMVKSLDMKNNIILHGSMQHGEVQNLLEQSQVFILPSVTAETGDMEGIPVALMEAMASGMPVLSTYHSGIPELIEDGKSGFLVPERDETALADKLSYLIDHTELWPDILRTARQKVEKDFNRQTQSRILLDKFQALTGKA